MNNNAVLRSEHMMLIQGFNGKLNLCISLKDISTTELKLLKSCKSFIENDVSCPRRYDPLWKRHPFWQNIQHIVKQLIKLNNKSEYHYLYALVIKQNLLELWRNRGRKEEESELMRDINKHYLIAYQLDCNNPANIFYLIDQSLLPPYDHDVDGILHSYHQIEMKLSDTAYRAKYQYVIDELECKFINCYCLELRKQSKYTISTHSSFYHVLIAYFDRYSEILESISTNDNYLFMTKHLKYCSKFAMQFREFGKLRKTLDAMQLFITNFDRDCYHLQKIDREHFYMMIDIMLSLGLFKECKAVITKLVKRLNVDDANSYTHLTLASILCRMYADDILYANSNFYDKPSQIEYNILYMERTLTNLQRLTQQYRNEAFGRSSKFKDGTYYYSKICLLYLKIVKSATSDLIEQDVNTITYIIDQELKVNGAVYDPCYFAEGCFMLAFIYQYIMKNVKCASFLYYLSILHIYDVTSFDFDFLEEKYMDANAPICYTNILAYFNMSICLSELKQYQLSLKLLKRILRFSKEMHILPVINNQIEIIEKKLEIEVKCNYCNKNQTEEIKMKSCKECALVFYCSVNCQKRDWKLSHKLDCSKYWADKAFFIDSISINRLSTTDHWQHNEYKKALSKCFLQYISLFT